jgi:hypothetical protein
MTCRIRKMVDGQPVWFKGMISDASWGSRDRARVFATKGEAQRVAVLLPAGDRPYGSTKTQLQIRAIIRPSARRAALPRADFLYERCEGLKWGNLRHKGRSG